MDRIAAKSDPSRSDAAAIATALAADTTRGLDSHEAALRLARDGPNELHATPPVPRWRKVLAQFQDPLVYLLLAALAIAFVAWAIEGWVGWPIDALVITVIVVLNGVLGYLQEARAEDAVAALAKFTTATSSVLRDGQLRRLPSAELVKGDLLMLGEGDAVGADARLVQSASLRALEASLTGESEAVLKDTATLPSPAALGDRLCMVFKGTSIAQGTGRAVVTATGMDTEVGSIASMLDATPEAPTPLETEVQRIGRALGIAVVVIAVVVVGTILLISDIRSAADVIEVLLVGVSLAVAAVICSDKTGTLTRSEMTIERVMTASGSSRITGTGYAPDGQVEHEGAALTSGPVHQEHVAVLSGGSLAGNAELRQTAGGEWRIEGDPTEAAFLVAERKFGMTERRKRRFERVGEIPFTSERKMMSTIECDHENGDAVLVITKGAPDVLLGRCTRVRVGMETVELDAALSKRILTDVDTLSDAALRTLAVAYRLLAAGESRDAAESLEHDLAYVGTVGMIDPPRPEAAEAIREARRAGIRVMMITGDHPRTAARIAADLGIVPPGSPALTGLELDAMDDPTFNAAVQTNSVYARVAPMHKLRIVAALQAEGDVVAMTGDGVNDAPALKAADIGIAMGVTGTEVTKQAAKMILADDNFATIVVAVREGRGIFDSIRKFLRYLLSSNMGEVLTVFLGVVGASVIGLKGASGTVVLPLLATQILWFNLVTDSGPALAMGVDPPSGDVMALRPRRRDERIIDARMWSSVVQIGIVMALATLLTIDLLLPGGLVEGARDLTTARTAGFTVLVFAQLFNCFNARSDTVSAFSHPFVNRWLWGAVALSALLQVAVVSLPFLNTAFGTVPLTAGDWALCVAMGSSVLWCSEVRKTVNHLLSRTGSATVACDASTPSTRTTP